MGMYINVVGDVVLPTGYDGKLETLQQRGAKIIDTPTEWVEGLVCVVDNMWMAAAIYVYDERELKMVLNDRIDNRPKTWMYFPEAKKWAS